DQVGGDALHAEASHRVAGAERTGPARRRTGWPLPGRLAIDGQAPGGTSLGAGFHSRRPRLRARALLDALPAFNFSIDAESSVPSDAHNQQPCLRGSEGLARAGTTDRIASARDRRAIRPLPPLPNERG